MKTRRKRHPRRTRRKQKGGGKFALGCRVMNTRSPGNPRTGVVKGINDNYVYVDYDYSGVMEKVDESLLSPMTGNVPCQNSCATCGRKAYHTPGATMEYYKQQATEALSPHLKEPWGVLKNAHSVGQRMWKIKNKSQPLYTSSLVTCSALMMDIGERRHFLTHVDGAENDAQIAEMVQAIRSECGEKEPLDCISNIEIWTGIGSEMESGFYLNNPNKMSFPVIVKILEELEVAEFRYGEGLFYLRDDQKITVNPTCFAEYVGR